jgi:hypothetical protein
MRVIGIDPGKTGAIAVREPGRFYLLPMPLIRSTRGRDEYDIAAIARALTAPGDQHVIIERQQALPAKMGGGLANFGRGYALGMLEGICSAAQKAYTLVTPRTWQGAMLAGAPGEDTKVKAVLVAGRLFPTLSLLRTPRSRVPDHGFADASLIAEWGWRKLGGASHAPVSVIRDAGEPVTKCVGDHDRLIPCEDPKCWWIQ